MPGHATKVRIEPSLLGCCSLSLRPEFKLHMTETTVASPITLTPGAVAQLVRLRQEQGVPAHYGLRIGVKGGGCSGFSYLLGFDEQKERDTVYDYSGVRIFMDKAHSLYLIGMELSYAEIILGI